MGNTAMKIIGGIIIVLALTVLLAKWLLEKQLRKDAQKFMKNISGAPLERITENDLKGLPEPVKRYFNFIGLVGNTKTKSARLRQHGTFRRSLNQQPMAFTADQYFTTRRPGFMWIASFGRWMKVRDTYEHGEGSMWAKLLVLKTVANSRGDRLNQGALLRYFSEMVWFPGGYVLENIQWEATGELTFKGTLIDQELAVTGYFEINEEGALKHFSAERYMEEEEEGDFRLEQWSIEVSDYRKIDGFMIPLGGRAIWNLEKGDFEYINLEIEEIQLNATETYQKSAY